MKKEKEKRNKSPSILTVISGVVLTVAVVLAILLAGTRLIGLTPYAVISGSMAPKYPVGSLIYVEKTAPERISIGDPITFVLNERLMVATHRVVDIREDGSFITKGDANDTLDGTPVHPENLLGKPQFSIPYLGYLAVFLASGQGKIILFGVLGLLLLSLFLPDGEKRGIKREVAD